MKAVVVEEAGKVTIREIPKPAIQEAYDALVEVVCGSICNATDMKIVHRQFDWVTDYPCVLGHEVVGRVLEVGPKARHLKVGDLVSRPHANPPLESGIFENWGGFAEYGLVLDCKAITEDGLAERSDHLVVSADFDPVAATQMVTLRETLSFLNLLGVQAGRSLVIFGAGPVGISFSLLAKQLGMNPIIVVGRRAVSLERALSFGRATHVIDNTRENVPDAVRRITGGSGADWAVEAIGTDAVMQDALESLNDDGLVGLYGIAAIGDGTSALRQSERVRAPIPDEAAAHKTIVDWVSQGLIPAREFVDIELPMLEAVKGLELLESKQAFKVLLWMNRG